MMLRSLVRPSLVIRGLHILSLRGEKAGQFNLQMAFFPNAFAYLLMAQLKNLDALQDLRKKNVGEYNDAFPY